MIAFWDLETCGAQPLNVKVCEPLCGVTLKPREGIRCFQGDRFHDLYDELVKVDIVVGFNQKHFDNHVLSNIVGNDWPPSDWKGIDVDLLELIWRGLGGRKKGFSLANVASATLRMLGFSSGSEMQTFLDMQRFDMIFTHCIKDVEMTAKLFWFIRKYGYVIDPVDKLVVPINLPELFFEGDDL